MAARLQIHALLLAAYRNVYLSVKLPAVSIHYPYRPNPRHVKSFLKKILKIGGLQKGTPFCEAACCSTFRVFVPFRPVTEGSQRHSALLRGGGPCECPAFPLQIGAQVVIGQRLWRPAEPYPSGLGGRNSLRLTLTDIGKLILSDKGEYLQHNIAQKRAHQILPLSGIQQRHVQYHNVNAFFFGQYSPLL